MGGEVFAFLGKKIDLGEVLERTDPTRVRGERLGQVQVGGSAGRDARSAWRRVCAGKVAAEVA